MTDSARIERERPGDRVTLVPKAGQSEGSIEADFERSFELSDELRAAGTQKWTSHYRWIGPFRFMAYKEVGPPPWRWPRVGIQPWRGKNHPCMRFIIGWRSTAFAFVVMWYGTGGSNGTEIDRLIDTDPITLGERCRRAEAEVRRLEAALDEAQLRSIEARNPGIDMEQVKAERARNSTCPHGRHFGGHYCEDCENDRGSKSHD